MALVSKFFVTKPLPRQSSKADVEGGEDCPADVFHDLERWVTITGQGDDPSYGKGDVLMEP